MLREYINGVDIVLWLRIWYGIASALWLVAFFMITSNYGKAFWRHRREFYPFVWSNLWVGLTAMAETLFYTWVIWSNSHDVTLRKAAVMSLPIMLATQATAYIIFNGFALWGRPGMFGKILCNFGLHRKRIIDGTDPVVEYCDRPRCWWKRVGGE